MGSKAVITQHYDGKAQVKFSPGNHTYYVTDDGFDFKGKDYSYKSQRAGGATSVTGVMDKGKGLQMWPVWEMFKFLKKHLSNNSLQEIIDSETTLNDLLIEGVYYHTKKSDLGKKVGTNAHDYAEQYFTEMKKAQEAGKEFKAPPVPEVEEIMAVLKKSYINIINSLKPKDPEEYAKLPKLLKEDLDIQLQIWEEATMAKKAIEAFREWCSLHEIVVIGTEQNTYSRTTSSKYLDEPVPQCGYYDATIKVTCSKKCGWCYLNVPNKDEALKAVESDKHVFTATYIADLKTTNTSSDFKMGIYPEYLPQCGVYDLGFTEEFPEIQIDGHLILNASKKDGTFATYFSFERERNREMACHLIYVKESKKAIEKDIKKVGEEYAKELAEKIKAAEEDESEGASKN